MNRRTFTLFVIDVLIVTFAFTFFIWLKPASLRIYLPAYKWPFVLFMILWIGISAIFEKYDYSKKRRLVHFINPILLSNTIILGIASVLIYVLNEFHYSRMIVLGTTGLATVVEVFIFSLFYYRRSLNRETERTEAIEKFMGRLAQSIPVVHDTALPETEAPFIMPVFTLNSFREQVIEEAGIMAYEYMCSHVDAAHNRTLVMSTTTRFNLDIMPAGMFTVMVNLKKINDIQRVNKFFETVNKKIPVGGIFIDCVETNEIKKNRFLSNYWPGINYFFYFFYYIFRRVIPKLPLLKNFYFFFTNGYDRSVSMAEAFGRLYSCGFEVVDHTQIGDLLYFVARKITEPSFDSSPTYGPLVSLRRVGKNGKIIYVYKLRTMHPYAEYLQAYVHKLNDLDQGGKFKNDFRVSTAGRFFRKFWLDELPMVFNLFKGDLKLVGVRPLSQHYFNLYTQELQKKRTTCKPGLIPPYYADMPDTLEEIMESEDRYLDEYLKHPLKTDWNYFWKAFRNIVFRRARSK